MHKESEPNIINSSSADTRLLWLDLMKGICALLVILVHTKKPEAYAFLFRPFFLTCFFFASGYTEKEKPHYIRRELVRTLIILILVEFVRILYVAIIGHEFVGWGQVWSVFYQNYAQYPQYTPMIWFVPCTCVAKVFFQSILRFSKGNKTVVIILSCIAGTVGLVYSKYIHVFLPWHIHTALFAQYYFCLGYVYRQYYLAIKSSEKSVLAASLLLYFIFICRGTFSADLALLNVSNWPRYLVTSILGTIAVVLVSQVICTFSSTFAIRFVVFVGKNSLFFFAFQDYFINMGYKMMGIIGASSESLYVDCPGNRDHGV